MGRCEEQRWREVSGGRARLGRYSMHDGNRRMGGGGAGGEEMGVRLKEEKRGNET